MNNENMTDRQGHGATDSGKRAPGLSNDAIEHRRRVRNLLATIRAIVHRTSRSAASLDDYVAHLDGRLSVLARVQEILMRDRFSYADLAEVLDDELLAQGVSREHIRVAGSLLLLDRTTAASLALALPELTTNAIKFGALSNADGRLSIGWGPSLDIDGWSLLEWREHSGSDAATAAAEPGFGFELIRKTLPYEIDAKTKIELTPHGLECEIAFRSSPTEGERPDGDTFGDPPRDA